MSPQGGKMWKGYEDAYERGPLTFAFKCLGALLVLSLVVGAVVWPLGWFSNAGQTAATEFYPSALLKKYEWFKDAAAALDKKSADIAVYQGRIDAMVKDYEGTPRAKWPRDEREQMAVWQSEVAGVKASYNSLAAEYNAQMAKFNWRFTNAGDVPQGGEPLPREYRAYVDR